MLLLLASISGKVVKNRVSRVDPCVDLLLPASRWAVGLRYHCVTKATKDDPHFDRRKLTGFTFGRGKISVRLYDKPKGIAEKSKKFWMYDVWGIEGEPDADHRIIRVEYRPGVKD